MAALALQVDPTEVGLDPARLERIDRHFERYVADGRLPGWLVIVARDGVIAHIAAHGLRDAEAGAPVELDTIWRIYSMTKPGTSVAAMMLWEEGAFELKDEVARFLPEFAGARVYTGGSSLKPITEPGTEPTGVWHPRPPTSGLTYGFHHAPPVDAIYREHGYEWGTPPGRDLAACCEDWARLPLLFQPGREWNYSVATDVLGRLVEVVGERSLDEVFEERIFAPLGMNDTSFYVEGPETGRLAALYTPDPATGRAVREESMSKAA